MAPSSLLSEIMLSYKWFIFLNITVVMTTKLHFGISKTLHTNTRLLVHYIYYDMHFCYRYLTLSGNNTRNEYNSTLKSYNKLVFDSGEPVVKAETHFRTPRIEFWYKYMYPEKQVSCSNGMKYKHNFSLMMICLAIKASLK